MSDSIKYSIELDTETATLAADAVAVESQVVVHVSIWSSEPVNLRIWGSTYLFDQHSNHHSKLVHFDLIEIALGEGCFEFKNITRNQSDVYYVES
jgi:hypothetical protein